MIRSFGKAKRAIRGDDDDGDVRASCDAVTLLALERTFYSSLNFLGVMTLTGVGLTAVGRGGKVPIAFGALKSSRHWTFQGLPSRAARAASFRSCGSRW